MRHNNIIYAKARKIVTLMRDYEFVSCSYCTGIAGKTCGDMACEQRFADQARHMIAKQEEIHGSSTICKSEKAD